MMTRNDFESAARAFRALPFRSQSERDNALDTLCVVLAATNPRFNRVRFINACTCMPNEAAQ
jgi:hypothetical protein